MKPIELELLDNPPLIFNEQGQLRTVLCSNNEEYPVELPFKIEGDDFIIDVSNIKDVWEEQMKDDLVSAIDSHFKRNFYLSHKDLNLVIEGI